MTTYRLEIVKDFELPEQDDAAAIEFVFRVAAVAANLSDTKPASVRLIDVSAPDSAGRVVWTNEP
jgi:hypothetical protein